MSLSVRSRLSCLVNHVGTPNLFYDVMFLYFILFTCFASLIIRNVEVLCLNLDTVRGCSDI